MNIHNIVLTTSLVISGIAIFRYFVYLIFAPLYEFQRISILKSSKKKSKKQIEKCMKISVIVPAWNEEVGITTSISSLLESRYNNLEIVVVNDGSTDSTNRIIRSYLRKNVEGKNLKGKSIVYINKRKNAGKGAALNSGIKRSSGDIIVTMDADTKFENDALYNVARYFQNKDIDCGVGNVKVSNTKSLLGLIQQIEYTFGFYFKRMHSVLNCEYIIGGAFGVYRRNIFEDYGYFDEKNKTEDIEFSTRLSSYGLKCFFMEDAIAYTEGASSLDGLLKQRTRWKRGRIDTFLRYLNLFFSLEKRHSKVLSWFVLPLALVGDFELLLFPILFPLIMFYTFDFGSFNYWISWIIFFSFVVLLSYLFGSKRNALQSILLIPVFYFLAFILVFTEIYAMLKSISLLVKGRDIVWKRWERKGVENV